MIDIHSEVIDKTISISRIINEIKGEKGPCLVLFGGIHGNEASGVFAINKVIEALKNRKIKINGSIIAISGNLWGLENNQRFKDEDLNRIWNKERLIGFKQRNPLNEIHEEYEQKEILSLIREIINTNIGPFYFLDLHTTSSETTPFLTVNDSLLNREFAEKYPLPIILGIEEYISGPLLSYINELGYVSFGFEAGQHQSVSSFENHESFIYLSLVYAGLISKNDIDFNKYYNELRKHSIDKDKFYEIVYRFEIENNKKFIMKDGFVNFETVEKNQILATYNNSVVRSNQNNRIFMPLYQTQGDDGFFLIRKTPKIFLKFSKILRIINFDSFLTFLPGIKWLDKNKESMLVNLNIARFFAKEFFHLLGYRSKIKGENHLIIYNREKVSRRKEYNF